VAVIEPAFWLGQPRTNAGPIWTISPRSSASSGFARASSGIRHYCTIGLNSKEANNEELAEAVMN